MPIRIFLLVIFPGLVVGCTEEKGTFVFQTFSHEGRDDVKLNEVLVFRFSAEIDPLSIDSSGLRIENMNGEPACGRWMVSGRELVFAPALPARIDFSDSGLKAGSTYAVVFEGSPRHCALLSTEGFRLEKRIRLSFSTVTSEDGEPPGAVLRDYTPEEGPSLISINGCALSDFPKPGLPLSKDGAVVLEFSEPLHPASVLNSLACLHVHEGNGGGAAGDKAVPLRCSFEENSGNRKVVAIPEELSEGGGKYDLRFEMLDFKDFSGNGIKNDFSYFRLICRN